MRLIALLLLFLLAACDIKSNTAADGYLFEPTSQFNSQLSIRVTVVQSRDQLLTLHQGFKNARVLSENEELFGFAVIANGVCQIFVVDPHVAYRPEEYGHELMHCVYGNFHAEQDRMRA